MGVAKFRLPMFVVSKILVFHKKMPFFSFSGEKWFLLTLKKKGASIKTAKSKSKKYLEVKD